MEVYKRKDDKNAKKYERIITYDNEKENLMKLCRKCHIRLHKIYKYLHIHK